jgi:hypothetical protein
MADDQAIDSQVTEDRVTEEPETEDKWYFLIDPAWQPETGVADATEDRGADVGEGARQAAEREVETPPLGALVGGWLVRADGTMGRFHANPAYEPATPDSPTDPVDATLRLAARGEMEIEAVFSVLREAVFGVAVDDQDQPVVALAPDDEPCLLVATAPAHRVRVPTHGWRDVSAAELAMLLAENRVDVLVNPGATTSTRLLAETVDRAARRQGASQTGEGPGGELFPN